MRAREEGRRRAALDGHHVVLKGSLDSVIDAAQQRLSCGIKVRDDRVVSAQWKAGDILCRERRHHCRQKHLGSLNTGEPRLNYTAWA